MLGVTSKLKQKKGEGDSYWQLKEIHIILILLSTSIIACVPLGPLRTHLLQIFPNEEPRHRLAVWETFRYRSLVAYLLCRIQSSPLTPLDWVKGKEVTSKQKQCRPQCWPWWFAVGWTQSARNGEGEKQGRVKGNKAKDELSRSQYTATSTPQTLRHLALGRQPFKEISSSGQR